MGKAGGGRVLDELGKWLGRKTVKATLLVAVGCTSTMTPPESAYPVSDEAAAEPVGNEATGKPVGESLETAATTHVEQPDELRLPNVEGNVLGIRHALVVRVSKKAVSVEGQPILTLPSLEQMANSGAGAALKRNGEYDLYIVPLGAFLEKREKPLASAVLYVDADIPFRLVVELLFTMGQNGVSRFLLATHDAAPVAPDRTRGFQVAARARGGTGAYTAILVRDGISVKSLGANVAHGCQSNGPGLAVLNKSDAYDFDTFTACLARLKPAADRAKQTHDVDPTAMYIVANPSVRYEDILRTMQAARKAGIIDFEIKIPA